MTGIDQPFLTSIFFTQKTSLTEINNHINICSDARTASGSKAVKKLSTQSTSNSQLHSVETRGIVVASANMDTCKAQSEGDTDTANCGNMSLSKDTILSPEEMMVARAESLQCLLRGSAKRALQAILLRHMDPEYAKKVL